MRGTQKRHLLGHKMGVVDEDYVGELKNLQAVNAKQLARVSQ